MINKLEHFSSQESKNNFLNYSGLSSYKDFHDALKIKLGVFYEKRKGNNLYKGIKAFDEKHDKILAVTNGKKVTGIEWSGTNIVVYINEDWKDQEMVFDLLKDNIDELYVWNDSVKAYAEKQENQKALTTQAIKVDFILQVMDHVFQKNETEWFDELNSEDKLNQSELLDALDDSYEEKLKSYGIDFSNWEYSNLTLLNLQELFKTELQNFDELSQKSSWIDIASSDLVLKAKDKYLDMIMWIWDKYEWWASYLTKKEKEFEGLLEDVTGNKSIEELFAYLIAKHETIDGNNYQSTHVEQSYKSYIRKLHSIIFEKLKSNENSTDKQFLDFAKIITGRYQIESIRSVRSGRQTRKTVRTNNIDDNLRNQSLSNEIIMEVISRKGGVMDRINEDKSISIIIEDEKIWNQLPTAIVNNVVSQIKEKSWTDWSDLLKIFKFWDVLDLWERSYDDLRLEQKIKISILVRFLDKIKDIDKIDDPKMIPDLLLKVGQDANKEVVESLNSNFDAQWTNWGWTQWADFVNENWESLLSPMQIEIFDLYQDINGNWLFDFSDNSVGYAKIGWKVTVAILVWIATAPILLPATATAVLTWAVIWVTATAAWIALHPQWFDTKTEAAVWLTSELALWAATWVVWGVLVKGIWLKWRTLYSRFLRHTQHSQRIQYSSRLSQWLWVDGATLFSRWWARNSSIFAVDLIWLWFWVEMARIYWMNNVFHDKQIFEQEKTE